MEHEQHDMLHPCGPLVTDAKVVDEIPEEYEDVGDDGESNDSGGDFSVAQHTGASEGHSDQHKPAEMDLEDLRGLENPGNKISPMILVPSSNETNPPCPVYKAHVLANFEVYGAPVTSSDCQK